MQLLWEGERALHSVAKADRPLAIDKMDASFCQVTCCLSYVHSGNSTSVPEFQTEVQKLPLLACLDHVSTHDEEMPVASK